MLDYGKWKYQQAKRERDARKHQRGGMIHEVRMRPRIGRADMERKVNLVVRLLSEGDKVKMAVMFRGREMSHPEIGREVMQRALDHLKEVAIVERPPSMEGRFLSVILTPGLKKVTKPGSDEPQPDETEEAEAPAEPQADSEPAATKAKVTG